MNLDIDEVRGEVDCQKGPSRVGLDHHSYHLHLEQDKNQNQ